MQIAEDDLPLSQEWVFFGDGFFNFDIILPAS